MKVDFSLQYEGPFALLRRVFGCNVLVRAMLLPLLCWVPLAIWAVSNDVAFNETHDGQFFRHFDISIKFLLALPVLLLSASFADKTLQTILQRFVDSGVVRPNDHLHFKEVLATTQRRYQSVVPFVVLVAVIFLINWYRIGELGRNHELVWTHVFETSAHEGGLSFGGWWFVLVASPVFAVLLGMWGWALINITVLFARIARMDLDLVATHADRVAGLGFILRVPLIFVGFTFAVSASLAGRAAHDLYYHGATLQSLKIPFLVMALILVALQTLPLWVFAPKLAAFRKKALFEYGTLLSTHGRLVRDRWLLRKDLHDDRVLNAPELGSLTDVNSMYESVQKMRIVSFNKDVAMMLLVPIVVPFIPVVLMRIPLRDIVSDLITKLF